MKLGKFKIKDSIKGVAAALMVFTAIGFVEKKQHDKVCHDIRVSIENQYNNYFINRDDIIGLVTNGGYEQIIGTSLNDLKLKAIENRIRGHKYILDAEVYKDLEGNLMINAVQSKPIARVVQPHGPDAYIDMQGHILPTSPRFTARVMVIEGEYAGELVKYDLDKTARGKALMDLLQFILADEFWEAQIAALNIESSGDVIMYPQVGRQYIEFGKPEDIEAKFKKLKIFYSRILPHNWDAYERVNLKYENQIICE